MLADRGAGVGVGVGSGRRCRVGASVLLVSLESIDLESDGERVRARRG